MSKLLVYGTGAENSRTDFTSVSAVFRCPFALCLHNTWSFAEALNGVLLDYGIAQDNVTAVTTDTAANHKTAILDHTGMEWLPCICNVLGLVMDVLIKHFAEVHCIVHVRVVVPKTSSVVLQDNLVDK